MTSQFVVAGCRYKVCTVHNVKIWSWSLVLWLQKCFLYEWIYEKTAAHIDLLPQRFQFDFITVECRYSCWTELPMLRNASAYLCYFADPHTCRCGRGWGLRAGGSFINGSHIRVKCKYTFKVNLYRETYEEKKKMTANKRLYIFFWCCPVWGGNSLQCLKL